MSRSARRLQQAIRKSAYNIPTAFAVWGSSSAQGSGGSGIAVSNELQARFGIPAYNGGIGGQWSTHIAARQGGRQAALTSSNNTVPASGSIDITTPTMNMATFTAAGALLGISGTLASSGDLTTYTFTRSGSGSSVALPSGTPFVPTIGSQRRANATLIWAGKNDITSGGNMTTLAEAIQAMVDYLEPGTRYLVMGHFADSNMTVGTASRTRLDNEHARLASTYGNLYVDVFSYINSSQVWTDSGVTPTATDLSDQAAGIIPTSLRYNGGHLNGPGYTAVAKFVGDIIEEQNWF